MPFDIRQLRYAIAAADHGSFYRAARALDIEQSTLSRNILKLERVVGTPIFERSRAGVTTTGARYPDVVYRPIHGEQGPALIGYSGYWRDDNRNPTLRRFLGFIKTHYALAFDFPQQIQ